MDRHAVSGGPESGAQGGVRVTDETAREVTGGLEPELKEGPTLKNYALRVKCTKCGKMFVWDKTEPILCKSCK